ncbi:MAG: SGNH/GDSL hydrolase family protein, partial [Jatrophihabitans endophyticus]
MQRLSAIATWVIVALAVVVVAAAVYVIGRHDPVRHAGQSVSVPTPSDGIDATSARATSPAARPRGTIAFLGDDWTSGVGALPPSKRFSTLVAHSLELTQRNFGVAGTGYAKSSDSGGSYLTRVAAVVASDPDVVVVSGGR